MNKKDFTIFQHHPELVYLDSAATSQKPASVIDAEKTYYEKYCSNVHRGLYRLSEEATELYENAREKVAKFIHAASPREIIFTRGATESLNIIAQGFARQILKSGDEIVVTILEHHSNIVPWQMIAKKIGCRLTFWNIKEDGTLDEEKFNKILGHNTKILSITHVANALGTINPLKRIIQKAHAAKVKVVIDAAQSVPHMGIDVGFLDPDFLVFSGHKMLGPTGIGVLYAKERLLEQMEPFFGGGDMIREVRQTHSTWNDLPWKFEAGTPNIAGVFGLAAAIEYLQTIGLANIHEHEKQLLGYALEKLREFPFIKLYGPGDPENQSSIISFNVEGIHPHDVAALLNQDHIAIRAGHHCCMPLMERLKVPATCRVSFYLYNTKEDIDTLVEGLKKIHRLFSNDSRHGFIRRTNHRSLQKSLK